MIQILQITQATIRNCIEALCKDEDWGEPYFYDLKIIKKGEGKETEYMINPLPHKPTHEYIKTCFDERRINLEALFDNADPFSTEWKNYTPGIFNKVDRIHEYTYKHESDPKIITEAQAIELMILFGECDSEYRSSVMKALLKEPKPITSLHKLPIDLYDRIKSAAIKRKESSPFVDVPKEDKEMA